MSEPSGPSFSVCIPNYNYAHYVGETIESVLNQTYQKFEIIIADNASTDASVRVIESFKDDRIRLIKNQYNVGFAPNLQRATMYAQNQFINLLSSDDLMKPDALATYADAIQEQGERADCTVLISDVEIVDGESNVVRRETRAKDFAGRVVVPEGTPMPSPEKSLHRGHTVLANTLRKLETFAPFLTIVYPRAMWQALEGYHAIRTIGPDKFFNYKLLALDPDVIYFRKPLFQYRVHGSPNYKAQRQTLKQQIDDYLYTLEMGDDFLAPLGLTKADLIDSLLDKVCLKNGLTQLAFGSYTHAFRMLAFSLAAYPGQTLRKRRAYALGGLLAMGPLGSPVARLFYSAYRSQNPIPQPTDLDK